MNKKSIIRYIFIGLMFIGLAAGASTAQTTAFTYQGKLNDTGNPANAVYDMQFKLCNAATGVTCNQTGVTITNPSVQVTNGVFTVQLNSAGEFGATAFDGADRFIEIDVRPAGNAVSYQQLLPRQKITSAPYAIQSLNATTATTATNATQLGGTAASQFVQTGDARLSDARPPTAGNANYIQNTMSQQSSSNFNITGNGTAGGTLSGNAVNATTQYNIGNSRVLSVAGTSNLFAGLGAGTGASNIGLSNVFVGASAGNGNSTGNQNSFMGSAAGLNNTTGSNNSFFGAVAGQINTVGEYNTIVGSAANLNANNRVFTTLIGSNALATGNDQIVLGKVAGNYFVNGVNGFRPADTVQIPGNLVVTGSITGASKSFKIDYPLDPLNKTLTYTSIESPDIKNIYDGNVTTDGDGEATVTLPHYFEALNKDYRYQLTVIGTFAQAIVSDEIKGNSFKIKTDKPGVKVSWQVTGIRRDKFAEDNRVPNVQDKPESERGKCLYAPACDGKAQPR